MTNGPRKYGTGTERALFRVANGTCYFPSCPIPVITEVAGEHIVGVEIAHIYGAFPGSARFDPAQTDDDRRAFSNLILLCSVHHKLVDKVKPEDYPVELLQEWKSNNENAELDKKLTLGITEEDLEALLQRAFEPSRAHRIVEVHVTGGIVLNPTNVISWDVEHLDLLLAENPMFWKQPRVLVADIRNTGNVTVSVQQIDFLIEVTDGTDTHISRLTGRNDFGPSNPQLPYRLADGDAVQWYTKLETFSVIALTLRDTSGGQLTVTNVRAQVRLATGEEIVSSPSRWRFYGGEEDSGS